MAGKRLDVKDGDRWGELCVGAWFCFTGPAPADAAGRPVKLLIDVNGELCAADGAGVPVRGLTRVASEFDLALRMPGKRALPLTPAAQGGEIDVAQARRFQFDNCRISHHNRPYVLNSWRSAKLRAV